MTPAEMLSARLSAIENAVKRIAEGQAVAAEAAEVRAALLDVLDLVVRNPGIDAAVDDLYRSVLALMEATASQDGVGARHLRLLTEAYTRFRQRLAA
ncbi:hypothetical protein [Methylobacterium nodulans]|uniref:Uncharacterized protein n=1 Tax=Methylobacterium nodulans (strain LMG 21967 / CNCM I-2342 / ORS 2060) TaxID=460265 RepID=B8I9Z9_METNO|nr:hypothetical protein [Methylobacterium nodulans]ACL57227.1 conserved hypothetical protein [Methylobacterium nodulans ORS 2060]